MSLQKILQLEVLLEENKDPKIVDVNINDIDSTQLEKLLRERGFTTDQIKVQQTIYNEKLGSGQVLKKKILGDDKESIEWVLDKLGMIEIPVKQNLIPQKSIGLTELKLFNYSDIKKFIQQNFYKSRQDRVYIPVIIAQELLDNRSCKIYYYRESDKNNSELTLFVFNLPDINPTVATEAEPSENNTLKVIKVKSSELILLEDWLEFTKKLSPGTVVDQAAPDSAAGAGAGTAAGTGAGTGTGAGANVVSDSVPIYYEVYGTKAFSDIIKNDIKTQNDVFIQGIHLKKFDDIKDKDLKQNHLRLQEKDSRFKRLKIDSFVETPVANPYIPQLFGNEGTVYPFTEIEKFLKDRPKPQPTILSRFGFKGGNTTKKKKAVKKQFRKTLRQK